MTGRDPADRGRIEGDSGERELTDREALDVRSDRTRRAISSFMRIGDRPSTVKLGILPGLLPGVAVALVCVLIVGISSVASTALGGGASPGPSGTASSGAASGSSSVALASTSASPAAASSAATSTSSGGLGKCPQIPAGVTSISVTFAFGSTAQGWTARITSGADTTFSGTYDAAFGRSTGGSLTATTTGLTTSAIAAGTWSWSGSWGDLCIPTGKTVVSMTSAFDTYLDRLTGSGVSAVHTSMDLGDAGGKVVARIVQAADDSTLGAWVTSTGSAFVVPAAYGPSATRITLLLNGQTGGLGGATWHIDNVKLTIAFA